MGMGGSDASLTKTRSAQKRLISGLLILIIAVTLLMYGSGELFLGQPRSPLTLLLVAALTGIGFWFLNRNQLRLAVMIVNTCFFVAVAGPLLIYGLEVAQGLFPLLFIPLALSSLVLSRYQMLATAIATMLVFVSGLILQQLGFTADPDGLDAAGFMVAGQFIVTFIVLCLILDRFGRTTSAALATSQSRERALVAEMEQRQGVEAALQDEQNFSEAIIASLPGVFFVMDADYHIVRGNDTILAAGGYTAEQLVDLPVHAFVDEAQGPLLESRMEQALLEGQAEATIRLKRADGDLVPYLFRGQRFLMNDEPYLVAFGFDVSRIIEAERDVQILNSHLQERIERLTALQKIDTAIAQGSGPAATIDVILEQVTTRLGMNAAAVQRYDKTMGQLIWEQGQGVREVIARLSDTRILLGEGVSGQAALQRKPLYVHGATELQKRFTNWQYLESEGFEFYAAVPLLANGELEGVLSLFHRTDFEPDEDWRDFLDALASQAALALSSARLLENLQVSNRELLQAYDTTIEGWSRALDLRDEETEGHSQRVTELTVQLARRMGAPEERLDHIRRGALLHDIGKMGVPDSILLKPGRLNEEERRTMEQHPLHALELLQPIEFLQPALAIPHSHHENWDGSGYPQGLQGEDIPLAARAFAVVDVYDALTSDRPYRKAWAPAAALEYIQAQSGLKFDPHVVEQFTALVQETMELH